MFRPRFNSAKSEITCRLCIGRIKLLRNKKNLQVDKLRKEIADLLRSGKQEYARIRVEAVLRENFMLQAYEILELFLELLAVRSALVAQSKEIPRDMIEAISSIIYAASRVPDLPELVTMRNLLGTKYGKEYTAEASSDLTASRWQVNESLRKCLMVEPPQPEDKLSLLSEIGQQHNVEWDLAAAARDLGVGEYMSPPLGGAPAPMPQIPAAGHPPGAFAALPSNTSDQGPRGYANAHEAAAAAAGAARQAQAAADYAAHLVMPNGGNGGPGNGQLQQGGMASASTAPSGLDGWLNPQGPAHQTSSAPSSLSSPLPPPPASVPGGSEHFVVKSTEEIQRAYDNALGAPSKEQTTPSLPRPPSPAPELPSAPPAARPDTPGSVEDDLMKRFEALKRS